MKAQGHSNPELYPLCKLWNETAIAFERARSNVADEVILMQMAMATVVSGKTRPLNNALKGYRDGKQG